MLLSYFDRFKNSSLPLLGIEDTFQSYSSFTTNYLPPQDYESLMISASKIRGQSIRNLDRRERLETNLVSALSPLIILFLTYTISGQYKWLTGSIPAIYWVWTEGKIPRHFCHTRSIWKSDLRGCSTTFLRRSWSRGGLTDVLDELLRCIGQWYLSYSQ